VRVISLLYHDVVPPGQFETSGFPGGDASIYKLELPEFERHLKAIHSTVQSMPVTISEIESCSGRPILLTFDDGGASAFERTAGLLETLGWHGHFFITTDWIGRDGFLDPVQIRDLHARGHIVGSHSCSHPHRMSHCSRQKLLYEWNNSITRLSDILGERVDIASVPGGYYSRRVAETAAEAGIRTLFTSEPQTSARIINGCTVLGRYTIQQGVTPATAAAIAAGRTLPRCSQFAYWNIKKIAKAAGGTSWLRMRKWILAR
jgi:peptidoglycan/xylan/chitin deacetylase (PgdA/CDA1 family)